MTDLLDRLAGLSPEKRRLLELRMRTRMAKPEDAAPELKAERRAGETFPLSFAQQRLWLLDRMHPGSATYNVPAPTRLKGALDAAALEKALGALHERHETLRTTFEERGGEPVQVIHPYTPFHLPIEDLSHLPDGEREEEMRRRVSADINTGFDLARGPVLRARLLRLASDDHVLSLVMHHIVSDGWSMGIFTREMGELYAAFRDGREPELKPLAIQYADFASWQRRWLSGETLESHLGFWRRYLGGAPPALELPADRPRPPQQSYRGDTMGWRINADLTKRLQALALEEGTTLFAVLLAAYRTLLWRWSGEEDVVVGTPIANRTRGEVEGLIGVFINTLALRTPLSPGLSFREMVRREKESVIDAFSHQDLPFERVVEELKLPRDLSRPPVFQVMMTLQNAGGGGPMRLAGLELDHVGAGLEVAKFDLTLDVHEGEGGSLVAIARYAVDLFDEPTVERFLSHLSHVLNEVADDPDRLIRSLGLARGAEREHMLALWNDTASEFPKDATLHRLFETQAARDPAAPALVHEGETASFGELDARANRLARRLQSLGVGPEVRVALAVEHPAERIVALLAVLKAGGAYVPIDPNAPPERRAYTAADAGARVLLAEARFADAAPEGVAVLRIDADREAIDAESSDPVESGVSADNLAYVMYTSGSTGKPKGVLVPHRGVVNLITHQVETFGVKPGERLLQAAPLHFDASVTEIFLPLCGGAAMVVATRDRLAPTEVAALIRETGVTNAKFTPSGLAAVPFEELPALHTIIVGGEACPADLVARWAPGRRFFNAYGPTEISVRATTVQVEPTGKRPPLGGPLANVRAYVLDAWGQPVSIGIPGELYVGGAGVTRGYLGRPGLTAAAFVPDPFGDEPGARLYRTGDRMRWLADGSLEFLGRLDQQVKVRGVRIEPGEAEAALRELPEVADAVVVARTDGDDARLVAYFTVQGGRTPTPAELREALSKRLPDYLVPTAYVALDAFPMTPSGKLDRRALPEPEASSGEAYVAPSTETEVQLATMWAALLGVERVGVDDDFFLLGGHSLLATQAVSRIRHSLGVELPLRAIFEAPTLRRLAPRVESLAAAGKDDAPAIAPAPRDRPLPLSFAQERLWFLAQLEPESQVYNVPMPVEMAGALDLAALERALTELVRRHEPLRTVFEETDAGPVQKILPAEDVHLPVVDLTNRPESERRSAAEAISAEEGRKPFDLRSGPVFRYRLVKLADTHHLLVLSMHHVVTDAWSSGVLLGELDALYGAFSRGLENPLKPLEIQYADFAAWQREWLKGERLEAQLGYWREKLRAVPSVLEIPTDRPRPAMQDIRGASLGFRLPPEAAKAARKLAQAEGATLFMTLLAAFSAVLHRWSGQDDLVIGTPIANRTRPELERLVGFFDNTLALRADVSGDPSFRDLLGRIRETTLDAYAHQDVPFEKLVEELKVERSLSHTPLFQVMFTVVNTPVAAPGDTSEEALAMRRRGAELGTSRFDMTVAMGEMDDAIGGAVEYATALWDPATILRLTNHLGALLRAAAADPDAPVSSLSVLSGEEWAQVVEGFNATDLATSEALVHERVARQAALTPDAIAIDFGDEQVTYARLDARANRLAHRLRRLGVGPDERVAVALERSVDMIVSVLATLKAGGCYVAVDPAYPADRVAYMLEDSRAAVLLTTSTLADKLPAGDTMVLSLDVDGELITGERATAPEVEVDPENLLYVLYTSGSTGRPKGAALPHRALSNLIEWQLTRWGNGAAARTLQFASLSFDVSFQEIFSTLSAGGTLVLVDDWTRRDAEALLDHLREKRVERLFLPFAALQNLAEVAERADARVPDLREVITAGEALRASPQLRAFFAANPGVRLENQYGPSETHVISAHLLPTAPEQWPALPPIGAPVANTRLFVLDARMAPAPLGVPGELYAAGENLARGYLGRPDLTADRFVPSPFGPEGSRLYRTGDRARWRPDGELEYLGRTDFQVKIRGFRIEPGEVESAVASHPSVLQAAVVVRGEDANRRLVAYVVPRAGLAVDVAAIKAHVVGMLPEYMVPAAWVPMEELPLTPSGKVDRRSLPEPAADAHVAASSHVPPRTPAEEVVADIWEKVLGVKPGVHDDFFSLGGHSLKATQVVSRIRQAFGVELPLRALFEEPTVAALAARAQDARRHGEFRAPPLVPMHRDRPIPLSFAQQRFWFVEQLGAARSAYHIPVVLRLEGDLDPSAVRDALNGVVARHEALRTTFHLQGGEPVQVVAPGLTIDVPVDDLTSISDEDAREAEAKRISDDVARAPFDLKTGPLLRARIVRLAADQHLLLITLHHIVGDAWSLKVLMGELGELLAARREGRPARLAQLPVQYPDYALWQRERLEGPVLDRELAYWRERLEGTATLALPTDRPRPVIPSFQGAVHSFAIPGELTQRVRDLAREGSATTFMALLAAFDTLLFRWSGTDDVVVGSATAGRVPEETEGLVGVFVNTLALRNDLSGDPTFRELLGRVRESTLDAYAHQDAPFERLVDDLKLERSLSRHPLFQVVFSMHAAEGSAEGDLAGLKAAAGEGSTGTAKVDLTLALVEHADGITGAIQYATDLFDAATIERMAGHFRVLLEGAAADPDRRISDLPLMPAEETRRLLEAWTVHAYDHRIATVHSLVERWAERTPGALAAAGQDARLTYAELNARANRLAHRLRRMGVGSEARVAVMMERSAAMLVAQLAVAKAGGAYVPLDPAAPAERLAYMLEDSRAIAVITHGGLRGVLPTTALPVLFLNEEEAALAAEPDANPDLPIDPENLLYVIYTSGSTGRPKGVAVSHRGLANLAGWYRRGKGVEAGARITLYTSPAFDASAADVWGGLCNGASLHVPPDALRADPPALLGWLAAEEIDLSFLPTPAAEAVLEAVERGGAWPERLRLGTGGDELRRRPPAGRTLFNAYGPTEDSVASTFHVVPAGEAGRVSIGVPVDNHRVYLLDERLRPVPPGVPGDLYVAGVGVARGYLARPAMTGAAFVPDPLSPEPGARMYRTGDRARWRTDGRLEFLGRADQQVKIRGYRIEPGEIEAALLAHPAVHQGVVVVREDTGDKRLVAYLEAAAGQEAPTAAELRAFLKRRLPDYMVPAAFVVMEELPMTNTGKVDRRRLPAPSEAGAEARDAAAAPKSVLERDIAKVWEEVLGVEAVGLEDNFFEIGGHSLLLVRLQERLREALGREVSVVDLFQYPTVGALAAFLDPRASAEPAADAPAQVQDRADKRRAMMRRSRGSR